VAERVWPASMVAGGLLLVAGLSGLWGLVRYRVDLPVVPLSLGVGLGLLAYGAYLRRRRRSAGRRPRPFLGRRWPRGGPWLSSSCW
jgi:hypothetical protein